MKADWILSYIKAEERESYRIEQVASLGKEIATMIRLELEALQSAHNQHRSKVPFVVETLSDTGSKVSFGKPTISFIFDIALDEGLLLVKRSDDAVSEYMIEIDNPAQDLLHLMHAKFIWDGGELKTVYDLEKLVRGLLLPDLFSERVRYLEESNRPVSY